MVLNIAASSIALHESDKMTHRVCVKPKPLWIKISSFLAFSGGGVCSVWALRMLRPTNVLIKILN
jgi:hypothetical protein